MKNFKKIITSDWFLAAIIFICAAILRLIPELKAGAWPIGYDTSNTYSAELASYSGSLVNWITTANILYFIFLPFKLLGMSPDLIMKVLGPIIYGFLNVCFYIFARRFLKFSNIKSFFLGILVLLQLASLRLSWDLFRNELSLSFMFLALPYVEKISKTKNLIIFTILVGLVVLSNQLVTVLLFVILFAFWVWFLAKKEWENLVGLSIPITIMAILFTIVISSSGQILYNSHVFFTSEKNYFWRYFYRYDEVMPYWLLKQNILSLFSLLYLYLVPTAILGLILLRKNIALWAMTIWLLFGTFSSLILVGKGLFVWERWLFMLVFPLSIYSVEGLYWLAKLVGSPQKWVKKYPQLSLVLSVFTCLAILTFFFIRSWPFLTDTYARSKPPLANDELNSYFPRTMVHNSIGLENMATTLDCVNWLNQHAPSGSVVLVDNRYRGLMITHFDIDNRNIITNAWSETIQSSTLEVAKKTDFRPVYLIWNISKAIDGFDRIYSSGNRGVYQALPSFYIH
ncbi:MAG: hypothetical protein HW405_375 [Candidatus Berkelbacteria bacterium]|nr:hypothetical protein [Candidatus Berkelbacteria bacterium]